MKKGRKKPSVFVLLIRLSMDCDIYLYIHDTGEIQLYKFIDLYPVMERKGKSSIILLALLA
jgi:hypothetical protein